MTVEVIGSPTWRITTPVVFSAPYAEGDDIIETATSLFPAPLWGLEEGAGVVAGDPSTQDFEHYVEERVAASSYAAGDVFTTSQFSGGPAVYIVFLIIPGPGAPRGSSPDAPSGTAAMIPHDFYPFRFSGDVLRDCEIFDPNLEFEWDNPPASVEAYDGQTRIPAFVIDSYEFRSPESSARAPGTYLHDQTVVDSSNRGYHFTVQFVVE